MRKGDARSCTCSTALHEPAAWKPGIVAGKAALHQGGGTSPVSFDVKKTMEYTSLAWNRDDSARKNYQI